MSDIFCSGRSTECGCPPHICAAACPKTEAPVYRPNLRDTLAVAFFITVAAGFITFAVAARMEQEIKRADLIAQEVDVSWRK